MKALANVIAQHIGFVDQLRKTAINVEDTLTLRLHNFNEASGSQNESVLCGCSPEG